MNKESGRNGLHFTQKVTKKKKRPTANSRRPTDEALCQRKKKKRITEVQKHQYIYTSSQPLQSYVVT